MNIREALREAWSTLSLGKRAWLAAVVTCVFAMCVVSAIGNLRAWGQIRALEKDAKLNKQIAKTALDRASQLELEKIQVQKQFAEMEAKTNAKSKEAADAELKTLNARDEYYRTLRESRTDDPSTEQLCSELAALGYPCQ